MSHLYSLLLRSLLVVGFVTVAQEAFSAGQEESAGAARMADDEEIREPAKIEIRRKQPFGAYLTDSEGRSLYLFMADSKNQTTCYDACAEAWPPLLSRGNPEGAEGVQEQHLGTLKRTDGETQVTYNGWPLYYFVQDTKQGDVSGQDKEGFGAEWYLVSPEGEAIRESGEQKPGQ